MRLNALQWANVPIGAFSVTDHGLSGNETLEHSAAALALVLIAQKNKYASADKTRTVRDFSFLPLDG